MAFTISGRVYNALIKFVDKGKPVIATPYYEDGKIYVTDQYTIVRWTLPENMATAVSEGNEAALNGFHFTPLKEKLAAGDKITLDNGCCDIDTKTPFVPNVDKMLEKEAGPDNPGAVNTFNAKFLANLAALGKTLGTELKVKEPWITMDFSKLHRMHAKIDTTIGTFDIVMMGVRTELMDKKVY